MEKIDTGTDHLIFEKEDGVAILTMNRPEARNAMSGEMNEAMRNVLAEVELDPSVRCVVLTGAGKGFCAGGDVKGMASSGDGTVGDNTIDAAIHRQRVHQRATAGKLFKMPKPTIAALPGAAAGAGLSYALACDLRVMANNAIVTTRAASSPVKTTRPPESFISTAGCVVHAKPTRHPLACVTNTNCVAAPCTVTTDESTVMLLGEVIVARILKSAPAVSN